MAASATPRQIRLRWDGRCHVCGAQLTAGSRALHDRATRALTCLSCADATLDSTAVPCDAKNASFAVAATPVIEVAARVIEGHAGASATREYERRRLKHEAEARRSLGALGVVRTRLVGEPQSTAAWKQGADGEMRTAARLAKHLHESGVRMLHDR